MIFNSFISALITIVNCISVKAAVRMQDAFTYAKLICIAILVIIGIIELCKGKTHLCQLLQVLFDNSCVFSYHYFTIKLNSNFSYIIPLNRKITYAEVSVKFIE